MKIVRTVLLTLAAAAALALNQPARADDDTDPPGQRVNKPVSCFPYEPFMLAIVQHYKELVVFSAPNVANDGGTILVLTKGGKNGSWTVFEFDTKHTVACILATGFESET